MRRHSSPRPLPFLGILPLGFRSPIVLSQGPPLDPHSPIMVSHPSLLPFSLPGHTASLPGAWASQFNPHLRLRHVTAKPRSAHRNPDRQQHY